MRFSKVLDDVAQLLTNRLKARNCALEIEIPPETPCPHRYLMSRVILNLLQNAMQVEIYSYCLVVN